MNIFQCIISCVIISILPPVIWIYSLIVWILGGCRIKAFTLKDVTICENSDDDMNIDDFTVFQQMIDDFVINAKSQA